MTKKNINQKKEIHLLSLPAISGKPEKCGTHAVWPEEKKKKKSKKKHALIAKKITTQKIESKAATPMLTARPATINRNPHFTTATKRHKKHVSRRSHVERTGKKKKKTEGRTKNGWNTGGRMTTTVRHHSTNGRDEKRKRG